MRTAPLASGAEPPRVAYAVSRAVGPAVVRNRVRRRFRAAVRNHASQLEPGHGYLFRARPEAAAASYAEIDAAIATLLGRTVSEQAR